MAGKHGRFKLRCAVYRNENRREKSKARKLHKHLRSHPEDGQAKGVFGNLARWHLPRWAEEAKQN